MEHTTFYQYRKPIRGVDRANIDDENYNWDRADAIEHSTQISLAPAYDSSETYNTGDVVMYEFLMYECVDDGVTGTWNPAKWTRTTAGEHGGGSDVEANPQGTPTDNLTKLGINGTIYNIAGSGGGGGNVYGAFIDTNRIIQETITVQGSTPIEYTATEDCCVIYTVTESGSSQSMVYVNNTMIKLDVGETDVNWLYLKSGDALQITGNSAKNYTVFGLTFGTQNIFTPQIYSTEERCVGVWKDNKPLYQKTIPFSNVSNSGTVSFGIADVDNIFLVSGKVSESSPLPYVHGSAPSNNVGGFFNISQADTGWSFRCGNDAPSTLSGWICVAYTKTTDTAGSGSYNTLGVPTVHYSTTEQVIGTAEDENGIIKPLYEKMTYISSLPNATETEYSLGITNIRKVYYVKCIAETSTIALPLFYNAGNDNQSKIQMFVSDKLSGKIKINTFGDNRSGMSGTVIIRYTKTTD